ncbi:hypothetical protein QQF64_022152, partial [Cirrhinus molitorella]
MDACELRDDDKAASPDSELNEEPLLLSADTDSEEKMYGGRVGSVQSDASSSPTEHGHMGQSHPTYPVGPQSLLVAQQLASAVSGVMSGGAPGLNQPILIPFNAGGHLGGQQGLVLSLPTAANIQGLVAAAAAGGIMTLPLQNLQVAQSHNLPQSYPIIPPIDGELLAQHFCQTVLVERWTPREEGVLYGTDRQRTVLMRQLWLASKLTPTMGLLCIGPVELLSASRAERPALFKGERKSCDGAPYMYALSRPARQLAPTFQARIGLLEFSPAQMIYIIHAGV